MSSSPSFVSGGPIHRMTTTQEELSSKICNPLLRKIASIREDVVNGCEHDAENFLCTTIKMPDKPALSCVAMFHDGNPFASLEDMFCALFPNTSNCEDVGAMGCGGMLGPLLLVDRTANYRHFIYSRIGDGELLVMATIEDLKIRYADVTKSHLPWIKEILGKTNKKSVLDDYNVGYLSNCSLTKNYGVHNSEVMAALVDFMPHWIGKGRKVHFIARSSRKPPIFTKDRTFGDEQGKHFKKNLTPVPKEEQFDEWFLDDNGHYDFKAENCLLKVDSNTTLMFSGRMSVRLYPGLYKTDPSSNASSGRFGMVYLRGNKGSCGWLDKPQLNTFVFSPYYKETHVLGRVAVDPHYAAAQLDKIGRLFSLSFSNVCNKFDDVVEEFPEFAGLVPVATESSTEILRNPFAKVCFYIDDIHEIRIDGQEVAVEFSDVRSYLGGLNEMFLTSDNAAVLSVIDCMCSNIRNNTGNHKELSRLRIRTDKLWPTNMDEFDAMPVLRTTKDNRLCFQLEEETKGLTKIAYDDSMRGTLTYSNGSPVNPSWVFSAANPKFGNTLKNINDENLWLLTSGKLKKLKEGSKRPSSNGDFRSRTESCVDEEDFLSTSAIRTWPYAEMRFEHEGTVFVLNTKVNIPKRPSKPHVGPLNPTGVKKDGKQSDVESTDYIAVCGPSDMYLRWDDGLITLNAANKKVEKLFKNIPGMRYFRTNFLGEIRDTVPNLVQVAGSLSLTGFKDKNNLVAGAPPSRIEKLQEVWGTEYFLYLLNELVRPLFENPKIKKRLDEIDSRLAGGNGDGVPA